MKADVMFDALRTEKISLKKASGVADTKEKTTDNQKELEGKFALFAQICRNHEEFFSTEPDEEPTCFRV